MAILGIETSCDETGIAVFDGEQGLLAHELYSQITTHAPHGGVVPELAARDHIRKIIPLVTRVMEKANIDRNDIDAIAYTAGPGLAGPLLVGAGFAAALAYAWQKPTLAIHHLEGHLLSPFLDTPNLMFPFLALLVSGGHTLLADVKGVGQYQILGESLDDAAGEAFDKIAKVLHLGYPGGALLAELAKKGDPKRFHFPRPLTDKPGLDFSFSGLKTAVLQTFKNTHDTEQDRADIACAFQEAVTDTLILKCQRALSKTGYSQLVIAGGVGANQVLRQKCQTLMHSLKGKVHYPRIEFCTDNGAMIAYAGYQRWKLEKFSTALSIQVRPRWPLCDLH